MTIKGMAIILDVLELANIEAVENICFLSSGILILNKKEYTRCNELYMYY